MPLLIVLVTLLVFTALAGAFPIARDGQPAATIVLAERPTLSAQFAAEELVRHIKAVTGADLPVVTDRQPVEGPVILVGESLATQALGLHSSDFADQEYLIRCAEDRLVLLGKDDTRKVTSKSPRPSFVEEGAFGGAASFDGNQCIGIEPVRFDDEQGTFELWAWLPEPSERDETFLRMDGTGPWTYHILQQIAGSMRVTYWTYDGQNRYVVESRELAPGWHYIAATYDAKKEQMELYVDGLSQGTATFHKTTCAGTVMGLGSMSDAGGSPLGNSFSGLLDEVRYSTEVLPITPSRREAKPPVAPSCALSFSFDEASGAFVEAISGASVERLPDLYGLNGTLYAVYDFLERACGVRWYAPTDLGLVAPKQPTLEVEAFERQHQPAMQYRWITPTALYMPGPPDALSAREVQLWKLRMRIGGRYFWVCHSFGHWPQELLAAHPEWFAQGYEHPSQPCYTNPGALDQITREAEAWFDREDSPAYWDPRDVFGIVPSDDANWCQCDECIALRDDPEPGNQQFNNRQASRYVWGCVNEVARRARGSHPNEWIGALAYWEYAYYPEGLELEPNVWVQTCLHTRNWWSPSMEANDRRVLSEWRDNRPGKPLYVWLYYNFPALNAQSEDFGYFPGFNGHQVVEQMALYRENEVTGIFMEHSSEFGQSFLMDQVEFYVSLKLADDPTLDGDALIDEFFRLYYGAAAKPMQALYNAIEDVYTDPDNYPDEVRATNKHYHQSEEFAWRYLGTPERMADYARLMEQARASASTPLEQARVAAFDEGIWQQMVAGRAKWEEKKEAKARPAPEALVPSVKPAGGDPDGVAFSSAIELAPWRTLGGLDTERQVTAFALHDGEYLYLQLEEAVDPSTLKAGPRVWDGDDFEIFLATDKSGPVLQVIVGPTGALTAALNNPNPLGARTATRVSLTASDTANWRVRLAIPLSEVPGFKSDSTRDLWANCCRAKPGATGLLAWSPTHVGRFCEPAKFGRLTLEGD